MYVFMIIFGPLLLVMILLVIVLSNSSKNSYERIKLIFTEIAGKYDGEMTDTGAMGGLNVSFPYRGAGISLHMTVVQFRKYTNVYSMTIDIKSDGASEDQRVELPVDKELTSAIIIDAIDSRMSDHDLD